MRNDRRRGLGAARYLEVPFELKGLTPKQLLAVPTWGQTRGASEPSTHRAARTQLLSKNLQRSGMQTPSRIQWCIATTARQIMLAELIAEYGRESTDGLHELNLRRQQWLWASCLFVGFLLVCTAHLTLDWHTQHSAQRSSIQE